MITLQFFRGERLYSTKIGYLVGFRCEKTNLVTESTTCSVYLDGDILLNTLSFQGEPRHAHVNLEKPFQRLEQIRVQFKVFILDLDPALKDAKNFDLYHRLPLLKVQNFALPWLDVETGNQAFNEIFRVDEKGVRQQEAVHVFGVYDSSNSRRAVRKEAPTSKRLGIRLVAQYLEHFRPQDAQSVFRVAPRQPVDGLQTSPSQGHLRHSHIYVTPEET